MHIENTTRNTKLFIIVWTLVILSCIMVVSLWSLLSILFAKSVCLSLLVALVLVITLSYFLIKFFLMDTKQINIPKESMAVFLCFLRNHNIVFGFQEMTDEIQPFDDVQVTELKDGNLVIAFSKNIGDNQVFSHIFTCTSDFKLISCFFNFYNNNVGK